MEIFAVIQLVLLSQSPVITEVAANPLVEISGEFVEIFNPSSESMCLSGFSITDGDALDDLLPWDEAIYGSFPHPGMLLGTDTIPADGFALVFELDYPDNPVYEIPPGTLILTTADYSICNGLAASSDPLTLFNSSGTADSNAVSTYGTPVTSDIWQERDDDGLDGIPFDPGEGLTVERFPWSSPDEEGFWLAGPVGGTPGSHAEAPPDTLNISCDSVWTDPADPPAGTPFEILASFTCWGNVSPSSGTLTLFLDSQGDSIATPDEILAEFPATWLEHGSTEIFTAWITLDQGWYLPSACSEVPQDEYPLDDFRSISTAVGGGIDPVITEVICNPIEEDFGEFIEIYYPGPGIFPLTGCFFTDGDALDVITMWSEAQLTDPDAVYGTFLPADGYGLVLDPEYIIGSQPYDLAESTYVFTVENTTIGNGLTGNDPITLYDPNGTTQLNVLSTYGTPLMFDDPLLCDDDGLDGIPYDPGEHHSVQRRLFSLPDEEYSWVTSPEGGTPGAPAECSDTTDAAVDSLIISPPDPEPGNSLLITAVFSNRGTQPFTEAEVTIFLDMNADSIAQADEILLTELSDSLYPGEDSSISVTIIAPETGCYPAAARISLEGDLIPENDFVQKGFTTGGGVPLVISEVLCNPSSEDHDEFIELWFSGPGVFDISGCTFTDGDALDELVPWNTEYGILQDPDVICSQFLPADCFAVILDREYTDGLQPYDFPSGTVILTTGNTTLGDGLSQNDPVSLYAPSGTASSDVMSTYGTPVDSDDPLLRDDDGLDEIPFDPGEDNSAQRKDLSAPDAEENWITSNDGPTPGAPPPYIVEGMNATSLVMSCSPPMGPDNENTILTALFTNSGTDTIPSGHLSIAFFSDADQSGTPSENELIDSYVCGTVAPGDSIEANCQWVSCQEEILLFSVAICTSDSFPSDDTTSCVWNAHGSIVLNEIMYSPTPGEPEWVEIINISGYPVQLSGWTFEDSRDQVVFCDNSLFLQPDSFAVIVSDSSAFRELWVNVECPLLQPSSWPTLNNSTQQGEEWADQLILRDTTDQVSDYVPYDDDWGAAIGISLEKLDPEYNGYDPASWSGCISGGTPGNENSCTAGSTGGEFLEFHPNPFSPDGDGRDDLLSIEMNFDSSENEVMLEIYNVQGRLILQLLNRDICGNSRVVVWDGCGDIGRGLAVGRYIIYLSSRATDTGEFRETCKVVILARPL